jgi:hypothetical protein
MSLSGTPGGPYTPEEEIAVFLLDIAIATADGETPDGSSTRDFVLGRVRTILSLLPNDPGVERLREHMENLYG